MTSQEMMRATASAGYWFVNKASIGQAPNWVSEKAPPDCDPNRSELFGYDEKAFLAKQYR